MVAVEEMKTTREVEDGGGSCKVCGSTVLYLDAADQRGKDALRCPDCDFKGAYDVCGALDNTDNPTLFKSQNLDDIVLGPMTADPGPSTVPSKEECKVDFVRNALKDPAELFAKLEQEVQWETHPDVLTDSTVIHQPRQIAYQANDEKYVYDYPGMLQPLYPDGEFSPTVDAIRVEVQRILADQLGLRGVEFNSAHMNLYRSGADHVSWHTDEDVALYGPAPLIASVSLGAPRDFVLRRMVGEPYSWQPLDAAQMVSFCLGSGDLLVMRRHTQRHYEHCVRKARDAVGPRINLTFRVALDRKECCDTPGDLCVLA